jgi:hypothetical protein
MCESNINWMKQSTQLNIIGLADYLITLSIINIKKLMLFCNGLCSDPEEG